jgi:hypothetical protein
VIGDQESISVKESTSMPGLQPRRRKSPVVQKIAQALPGNIDPFTFGLVDQAFTSQQSHCLPYSLPAHSIRFCELIFRSRSSCRSPETLSRRILCRISAAENHSECDSACLQLSQEKTHGITKNLYEQAYE